MELEMHLIRSRRNDGKLQISPRDITSLPLFMHCSGGSDSLNENFFFNMVRPVMEAHGIKIIVEYKD
jgi:hypothetical protein